MYESEFEATAQQALIEAIKIHNTTEEIAARRNFKKEQKL